MDSKKKIDDFLVELRVKDFDKHAILTKLRDIVIDVHPTVTETFKYGGIMFSLNDNFGGLFVSKNHVSFEFTYGYKLTSNLKLEGTGKYRRHLKVKKMDDGLKEDIRDLLKQVGTID